MAKDDYHIIVYKILAYLYTQLKNGESIDKKCISDDGILFHINYRYWTYIIKNMQEQGYIRGGTITTPWGSGDIVENIEQCEITPLGIEYLCSNSFMKKAKKILKELKEITPFI